MDRVRAPGVESPPLFQRHRPPPLGGEPGGGRLFDVIVEIHEPCGVEAGTGRTVFL
ncbi:hypothetical protein D3C85_1614480 [compost metagenome]